LRVIEWIKWTVLKWRCGISSALFWLLFTHPCFPQAAASPPSDSRSPASAKEQVRLSEILISTPQPYDPAQVTEAEHKAEQVRAAIGQGGTFAAIARANSQGPTAAQGGDIGCFTYGQLARSLGELVFRMQAGDVSDVQRTKQGFVILEVSERGAHPCGDLELLNQPITAELKPYLETLIQRVRQRWYELMPQSARLPAMKQGSVTIEFSVQRDGAITNQMVASGSGDTDLDKAALNAVREASPLSPLPSTTKTDHLSMRFHFQYNPAKAKT
jgi:TonB family protein